MSYRLVVNSDIRPTSVIRFERHRFLGYGKKTRGTETERQRERAYLRKSLLQQAYMTGFIPLLIQPSHVTAANTIFSCQMHWEQKPDQRLTTKKGSQQMMKTPITIPNVLAAFFSLANLASLRDREKLLPLVCCLLILVDGILVKQLLCWMVVSGSSRSWRSSGVLEAVRNRCLASVFVPPPRCILRVSSSSPEAIKTCLVPSFRLLVWITAALYIL